MYNLWQLVDRRLLYADERDEVDGRLHTRSDVADSSMLAFCLRRQFAGSRRFVNSMSDIAFGSVFRTTSRMAIRYSDNPVALLERDIVHRQTESMFHCQNPDENRQCNLYIRTIP